MRIRALRFPADVHQSGRDPNQPVRLRISHFCFQRQAIRAATAAPGAGAQIADLSADWKVTFTSTNKTISEPALTDWTSDSATRFYSGEAVYERDFTLSKVPDGAAFLEVEGGAPVTPPAILKGPGMRAWYDPPVREAAIVFINGHRVGSLWHPPYRLAVGRLSAARDRTSS